MLKDWAFEKSGYDPIRARYGISKDNVRRAVSAKEFELNARSQEATVLGQQLLNASRLAEENYKQRQQIETAAQLTDAYDALQNANDPKSITDIYRRFPAVRRSDEFNAAYEERKSLLDTTATAAIDAAKLGALSDFNRRMSGPEAADPKTALAGAVDKSISDTNEATLAASGVDIPRLPDGTPDRASMGVVRAQLEAERLAPEERQFALDKWRMLNQRAADPQVLDEDKANLLTEISELETLLDPRKRRNRNAPTPSVPTTIPNDSYFEP
jgi:hypothetical protein